ncbi:MAG TPA: hypothetical protein VFQ65_33500 [Kofleriaceae bacterium]|nr:hypothetical protein [Kofleriaceae bacterium]
MRRTLIALLIAACGGPAKPTTPPPTLPEDKKPEPAPVAEAPKPAPPPKDPDPIDVPIATGKATYKLASAGKGQKAVIKIGGTQGAKQQLELAVDFAGKQVAPVDLGGTQEDVAPTLVLASALEVGDVDKDGAKFKVTFTGVDARDRKGAKATKEQFKKSLDVLAGVQLSGQVAPSGQLSNLSLHVQKPNDQTMAALELVRISLMPMWPIVPSEAIGVGAKWTVTTTTSIADRIEATQTTDYEVVSHKGTAWVLKGKTKLDGKDQQIKDTKFEKIAGTGGVDVTLTDGAFVPQSAATVTNDFTASVTADSKPASVQFHLEQGLAVTPVGEGAATPALTPTTPPAKPPSVTPPAPATPKPVTPTTK